MYFYIDFGVFKFDVPKICLLSENFDIEEYNRTKTVDIEIIGIMTAISYKLEEVLLKIVPQQIGVFQFTPGLIRSVLSSPDGLKKLRVCNKVVQDLFKIYMEYDLYDQQTIILEFSD